MADEKFNLPGSGFQVVVKLVKAYSHLRSAQDLKQFAAVAGVDADTVTRNNGFLISCGVITNTKRKEATPLGKELGLALDHEQPEAIAAAWKKVVDQNSTFHDFVTFVRNRGTVDADTLNSQICIITNQPKTKRSETGAGTVVNVLAAAGVIEEVEKGRFRVGKPQAPAPEKPSPDDHRGEDGRHVQKPPEQKQSVQRATDGPSLNVNVQVHISADATAEQIEKIFESMARHLYKS